MPKNRERQPFNWRYDPPLNSSRALVLKYLDDRHNSSGQTKSELMMNALVPHYLTLAQSIYEPVSQSQLKRTARNCITALKIQIQRIKEEVGLDNESEFDDSDDARQEIIESLNSVFSESESEPELELDSTQTELIMSVHNQGFSYEEEEEEDA
jgi:hypothetical protein